MFRKEVLEIQDGGEYSETIKIKPLAFFDYSVVFSVIILVTLLFVLMAHYTKKQTVNGLLLPKTGNVEVHSDRDGFVTDIFVEEGDTVKEGQVLAKITSTVNLDDGSQIQPALRHELVRQENFIIKEIQTLKGSANQKREKLESQRMAAEERMSLLQDQYALFKKQLVACNNITQSTQTLLKKGVASQREYFNDVNRCLGIQEQMRTNQLTRNEVKTTLEELQFSLTFFQSDLQDSIAQLEKELSAHRRAMIQSSAKHSSTILAPVAGEILSLRLHRGKNLNTGQLTVVMAKASYALEAHVYIPTRAIAFLKPGQKVKLRYDAYRYTPRRKRKLLPCRCAD